MLPLAAHASRLPHRRSRRSAAK